jgi:DNA-binding transcriptional ArsR family regulator
VRCVWLSGEQSNFKEIQAANYPTRKAILSNLKKGSRSVDELAKASKMNKKIFENHLKILLDLGLVESEAKPAAKSTDDRQISLTKRGEEILAYVEKLDMENIDWT